MMSKELSGANGLRGLIAGAWLAPDCYDVLSTALLELGGRYDPAVNAFGIEPGALSQ